MASLSAVFREISIICYGATRQRKNNAGNTFSEQHPCDPWLCGRQLCTPKAAYMAPIGWHVLAGLIVRAERSMTSAVVCLSNIAVSPRLRITARKLVLGRPKTLRTPGLWDRRPRLSFG